MLVVIRLSSAAMGGPSISSASFTLIAVASTSTAEGGVDNKVDDLFTSDGLNL